MNDKEIEIIQLTIYGLVQGIGFRPYVAELANELKIKGNVKNAGGFVYIISYENEEVTDKLICRLFMLDGNNSQLPAARVDNIEKKKIKIKASQIDLNKGFTIEKSNEEENDLRFLPPDIATCKRCQEELNDKNNRRYRHPFISCISCGPRFSIMKALPYDRETITMGEFDLCEDCKKEYIEAGNIRRHAQTIACNKCGPKLYSYSLKENIEDKYNEKENREDTYNEKENSREKYRDEKDKFEIKEKEDAFKQACKVLRNEGIVGVKDISGYHFCTSPFSNKANKRLRQLKNREGKPFAVMFPDIEQIKKYCYLVDSEIELLESTARPIVLLEKKDDKYNEDIKEFDKMVCMGSNKIGAMLPSNPLQILLMQELGPLVMTSGNLGGQPIITKDEKMLGYLDQDGIDLVLANDRDIYNGLDDSILQIVKLANGKEIKQIIRRARGYVPEPILLDRELDQEIFAAGGDLKAVFALAKKNAIYLSGHFGDLEDYEAQMARQKAIKNMEKLLSIYPKYYIADKHPLYISSKEIKADLLIQHHFAHVLSVAAEHNLHEKILGIAYDGTGYGQDGSVWGGEFLLCDLIERPPYLNKPESELSKRLKRLASINPIKMIASDEIAKNAKMVAICYAKAAEKSGFISKEENLYRSQKEYSIIAAGLENNINAIYSTSVGRLFDAICSLIEICHQNTFEGQCPQYLQIEGEKYLSKFFSLEEACKEISLLLEVSQADHVNKDRVYLDSLGIFAKILRLKNKGLSKEKLAFAFHYLLAKETIKTCNIIASKEEVNTIALSGGCMQNSLLLKMLVPELEKKYKVYLNEKVPAGDGGIALGQVYAYICDLL